MKKMLIVLQNRLKEIVNYRRNSVDYVRPSESYMSMQGHPQNPQNFWKNNDLSVQVFIVYTNRKQQFIDKISVIIKEINAILIFLKKLVNFLE